MVSIKKGVSIKGMKPEIMLALMIMEKVYDRYGVDLVITSGTDGDHGEDSLHYDGLAVDTRRRDFASTVVAEAVVEEIQEKLNGLRSNKDGEFDVVLESTHIHTEFDPKS